MERREREEREEKRGALAGSSRDKIARCSRICSSV
jgi:hypothetical protein